METTSIYCENDREHINILCEKNAQHLNVNASGTCRYHCALSGYFVNQQLISKLFLAASWEFVRDSRSCMDS
jgi:hypothetical protein